MISNNNFTIEIIKDDDVRIKFTGSLFNDNIFIRQLEYNNK